MSAELRAALERLDRFAHHIDDGQSPTEAAGLEWRELADDIRRALASTSIDGVSGTGLEELRRLSDAATVGSWEVMEDAEYVTVWAPAAPQDEVAVIGTPNQYTMADAAFIVAAVAYVRAALAKDGEEGGGG